MSSTLYAEMIQLEERLRLAMLQSDIAALDELIAPELIFTNHLGLLVSKQADLALHQSGVLKLNELVPTQQQIQLHDGFAIVSVLMNLLGNYENAAIDLNIRYTRVWSNTQNGAMQIVAGHASAVLPS